MAKNKTTGVEIKLSVDSSQLNADIKQINDNLRPVRAELKTLQDGFKFEINEKDVARAMELAQKGVEETVGKVNALQNKLNELNAPGSNATAEDIDKVTRALSFAGTEAKRVAAQFREIEKISLELSVEVTGAQQAINDSKALRESLTPIQKELSAIEEGFKYEVNPAAVQRAMELSTKAVQETAQNVKNLRERIAELEKVDTDEARAEVAKVKEELSFAETEAKRVAAQFRELNNTTLNQLKKQIDSINGSINKMGKGATMYIAAPLSALGVAAFKLSSDMQESMSKVDTVFGDSAKAIHDWANTTLESIGVANITALDMAAYFGDMATSMGYTKSQAAEMSKSLVSLAGDVASFKNIGLDQVQTALAGIFTGETKSLKTLGVVMTEANLKAYALKKGLGDVYNEMDQAEKTTLRYQYVMEMLANANGDFAKTIESPANQVRLLQESLKQLGATFGDTITPMITPFIKNINSLVQSFANLDDGTKKLIVKLATAAAIFGPMMLVMGQTGKVISVLISLIALLKSATLAKATADGTATATQHALNAAMSANPIGAVITAVTMLVAVLGSYAIASTLMAEKTKDLNDTLKETAKATERVAMESEKAKISGNAELDMVERQIGRFDELNGKVNKTVSEKLELEDIVSRINNILPGTIELIDDEANAYKILEGSIKNVIAAKRAELELKPYENAANQAAENIRTITEKSGSKSEIEDSIKAFSDKLEARKQDGQIVKITTTGKVYGKDSKKMAAEISELAKYQNALEQIENAKKTIEQYEKEYAKYFKKIGELKPGNTGGGGGGGGGKGEKTAAELELEAFKEKQTDIKYLYDMGELTESEYYGRLSALRDKYLAKNLTEWRSVTVQIKNYQDKLAENAIKAAEEAAKKAEELRKEHLSNFEKYVDEVARLAREEADQRIKALDDQADAYDRLMSKQNQERKLTQLKNKLEFEADEYNQKELQKQIALLQKEIQTEEMKQAIADQKAAIESELASVQAVLSAAKNDAANSITNTTTNNQFSTTNLVNASGLSAAQAEIMIKNAMEKYLRLI